MKELSPPEGQSGCSEVAMTKASLTVKSSVDKSGTHPSGTVRAEDRMSPHQDLAPCSAVRAENSFCSRPFRGFLVNKHGPRRHFWLPLPTRLCFSPRLQLGQCFCPAQGRRKLTSPPQILNKS